MRFELLFVLLSLPLLSEPDRLNFRVFSGLGAKKEVAKFVSSPSTNLVVFPQTRRPYFELSMHLSLLSI